MDIALGSATEVEYLLTLAHRLGYLSPAAYEECRKLTEELLPSLQKLLGSIEHFR